MPVITKVGRKSQIVIPKEIRESAGVEEGDEIIIDVVEGQIVIVQKPDSYSEKLRGLHKEIWEDVDSEDYLEDERESW